MFLQHMRPTWLLQTVFVIALGVVAPTNADAQTTQPANDGTIPAADYAAKVAEARQKMTAGEMKEAALIAAEAIRLDPARFEAFLIQGVVLLELGQTAEAAAALSLAESRAPEGKKPGIRDLIARANGPAATQRSAAPAPVATARAEAQPTLAETTEWLTKTVATYAGYRDLPVQCQLGKERWSSRSVIEFKGSIVRIESRETRDALYKNFDEFAHDDDLKVCEVDLSGLDAGSVVIEEETRQFGIGDPYDRPVGCLDIKPADSKKRVKWKWTTQRRGFEPQPPIELEFESLRIHFENKEMAERVAKAFRHAIRLSGGVDSGSSKPKKDPF